MSKHVNFKAILFLICGASIFGIAVHFLHGFQVRRNAHALLDQADELEKEKKQREAKECLEVYLGMEPWDTDTLARYGLLLESLAQTPRDWNDVYKVLEKVLLRDRDRQDIRRRIVPLVMRMGQFQDADDHLLILLETQKNDASLLQLRSRCQAELGHLDEAAILLTQAIRMAPHQVEHVVEYARLLRGKLEQPLKADKLMDRLVQENPRSVRARLARARYFKDSGKPERADQDVQFALRELDPHNADLLLLASELARDRGDLVKARQFATEGLKEHSQDTRLRMELARVAFQEGHPKESLEHLRPCLKAVPQEIEPLLELVHLVIDIGATQEARDLIRQMAKKVKGPDVPFLEARLLFQRQAWGEARLALEQITLDLPPSASSAGRVYHLLAQCYQRLGNPDQQLKAERQALTGNPSWLPARRGVATALVALSRIDAAIAEYRQIVAQAPELGLELAALLLARNRDLPQARRDWTEVEQLLESLPQRARKGQEATLLWAEVRLAQDKPQEARKLLETERDRDPKQAGPWLALVALAERQGPAKSVLPLIAEAEKHTGPRTEWLLAEPRSLAFSGRPEGKIRLEKLAAELGQFSAAEQDRLLQGLAQTYADLDDVPSAVRLWGQYARRQPQDLGVRFLLLEIAYREKKEADLGSLVKEIRLIEGKGGALAAYGEAAGLVLRARPGDEKVLAEARRHLAEAEALRPSWSRVPLLRAEIYQLQGNTVKALESYQLALNRGDSRLVVILPLLRLLNDQGRRAEALALLRKLPEQRIQNSRDLSRMTAALSLLNGNREGAGDAEGAREQALALARKTVADSKDYHDFLWLGLMAELANRPKEAEKAFRQAQDLAATAPETWSTLILFLARREPKKAEREMAEARHKLSPDQLPLVLGPGYEILGKLKDAEAQYEAALTARPSDPLVLRAAAAFRLRRGQTSEAEQLLRRLLQPSFGFPPKDVTWARRHLALTLVIQRNYARFREALGLLDDNLKVEPDSAEDRLAKALVLATHPGHRQEAIQLFESLTARPTELQPVMEFLLSQLYEAEGQWGTAQTHLEAGLKTQDKNPLFLGAYIRNLLYQKRAAEAQEWADQLAKAAPEAPETFQLRAQVLKANGKPEEAVALIREYTRSKGARLELAATWLEQLDKPVLAEAMYRQFVADSRQPESVLLLVQFLARRQRLPEALTLCEPAWRTCRPEAVANTAVGILRIARGDDEQYRQVRAWLTAALGKQPESEILLVLLAELGMGRGEYPQTVGVYRNVLKRNPGNVVALNNLAFLLALKEGSSDEALDLITRAIDLAGPNAELLDTRGVVNLQRNKPEEAVRELRWAVEQAPAPAKYFHLAQAQLLAKNRSAAQLTFMKATRLGLTEADLNPLERPALKQLKEDFDPEKENSNR